jgi:hypothetical protein
LNDKDKGEKVEMKKPSISYEQLQKQVTDYEKEVSKLKEQIGQHVNEKEAMFQMIMRVCNTTLIETLKLSESVVGIQKVTRESLDALVPQRQEPQKPPNNEVKMSMN